jgi:uncharacterized RDD family membrane protein YckC
MLATHPKGHWRKPGVTRMTTASGSSVSDIDPAPPPDRASLPTPTSSGSARASFDARSWASFSRRLVALAADSVIFQTPFAIVAIFVLRYQALAQASSSMTMLAVEAAYVGLFVLYHGLQNASSGMGTRGRRWAQVAVVLADSGERIGIVRACWRALVSLASALTILPDLLPLVTPRRRSFADLLAGTVVVQNGPMKAGGGVIATVLVIFLAELAVGGVAAVAIPSAIDFEVRSKVNEGLVLVEEAKLAVDENFQNDDDPSAAALSRNYAFKPTRYVASIVIGDGGAITITYDTTQALPQLAGQNVLTLQANINGRPLTAGVGGPIDWACASRSSTVAKSKGLSVAAGANLAPQYAPLQCR